MDFERALNIKGQSNQNDLEARSGESGIYRCQKMEQGDKTDQKL